MPIIGVLDSAKTGRLWPANSYYQIGTTTVGAGGVSSITFSSIPSTYTHLQIRGIARLTSTSNNVIFRPNNDSSTANYTYHSIYGDGTTTTADGYVSGLSGAYSLYATSNNQSANIFATGIIDVLDYANTNKLKTFRSLQGFDANGTGLMFRSSAAWKITSAISSLTLVPEAGNFAEYTAFALYGIKVA